MNQSKDYRFIFPITDFEFDLVEKSERQGIAKAIAGGAAFAEEHGRERGRLEYAWYILGQLVPLAEIDVPVGAGFEEVNDAIHLAIQRLRGTVSHE